MGAVWRRLAVLGVALVLVVGTAGCFGKGAPITGKRIIYSIGQQRVVLIDENEAVIGDFLVSGRLDLPAPGLYHVIQEGKRVNGWSWDGLRLPWFTRFAYGPQSDIGFHGIPIGPWGPIQSEAQLGQPLSHGCVRMIEWWAKFIFDWAPGGTPVEVQG